MRWAKLFLSTNLKILFVVSLLANIALGVVTLVLQPLWRAAAVTAALTAAEIKSEAEERRAVAKARAREKAKARLRRVAVAVPLVGIGIASAFEYAAYNEWSKQNPDKGFDDYGQEVMQASKDVAPEVVDELAAQMPEWMVPDVDMLLANLEKALQVSAGMQPAQTEN